MKKQQKLNIFINLTGVPSDLQDAYTDELAHYARFLKQPVIRTAYISALDKQEGTRPLLEHIIATLDKNMVFDEFMEVTAELNPANMDEGILESVAETGVNRVSFIYNRDVPFDDLKRLSDKAKECFEVVNFDLKLGRIPLDEREEAIANHVELCKNHFSAYGIKKNEEFLAVQAQLEKQGMKPYDPFHFAATDYECRYLVNVLRYEDYIGLGPGAHGCLVINNQKHHTENSDDVDSWHEEIQKKVILTPLSDREVMEEFLLQNLTLYEGIDSDTFQEFFGNPLRGLFNISQAEEVMHEGKPVLVYDKPFIRTTDYSQEGAVRAAYALLESRIQRD